MSADDNKGDIKKPAEPVFIADNLDNTASVDKILNSLQSKKNKNTAYGYYCLAVRQRHSTRRYLKNTHYTVPGHPLNDFSQDWDGGLRSGYFENFAYKSCLPKMIMPIRNMEKQDPVTSYMKIKEDWQKTLLHYKACIAVGNRKRKYEWIDDDLIHCPKQFVDMAAHWERNPDPYFESSYNWYYAGNGNFHLITINFVDYLLQSEFSCVYLSPFLRDDLTGNVDMSVKFDCGEDMNILETVSSQTIVALRTIKKIFILKLIESDSGIIIDKLKDLESEIPYTSISFDSYHKNILYVTTLDQNLKIVNIDRITGRSIKLKGNLKSLVDNWNMVIGTQRTYYTHISKNTITLYDKRTSNAFQKWNNVKNIIDDISCNDISVAKYVQDTPYMYFGTDHHLFLLDTRYNQENNMKAIQRWTHGMQCVPTYMSICTFEYNKELVSLSSQWCEDLCVVSNYADRTTRIRDIQGVTIPYRLPSIFNTLNEAREQVLCSDLLNPIDGRLSTSITGQLILEQDENYNILLQNSLGDISLHTLYPEHMMAFVEDDGIKKLDSWSKNYKSRNKEFEVSSIINISNIWKQLKKIPEDSNLGERKYLGKKSKFDENEIFDLYSKAEVDPGLLDLWIKDQSDETLEDTKQESTFQLLLSEEE